MSLHRLTEDTAWHDQPVAEVNRGGDRAYEGRAKCSCGWVGSWRGGSTQAMHDCLRSDYREHVEQALGADAYYEAAVQCRNCGSKHDQPILIGTHVSSALCARCGTTMIEPDNETWHDSQRAMARWFG